MIRKTLLAALLALASQASAGLQLQSRAINPIGSIPSATNSGSLTTTKPQFAAVGVVSGYFAGGEGNSATSVTDTTFLVLTQVQVGTTYASGTPRYLFGDRILPPLTQADGVTPLTPLQAEDYWRARPVFFTDNAKPADVVATEFDAATGLPNRYHYSVHSGKAYASQSGPMRITWVAQALENGSPAFLTETFNVSASTSSVYREKTIYWTESENYSPPVALPSGQLKSVDIIYNRDYPEFIGNGESLPDTPANLIERTSLRTFWVDQASVTLRQFKANNLQGKVLIEYLGDTTAREGERVHLGLDVVRIVQEAESEVATTFIGDRVLPQSSRYSASELASFEANTNVSGEGNFFQQERGPDGDIEYYAVKENPVPGRVPFYWMSEGNFGLRWPELLNIYNFVWPDSLDQFARFATQSEGAGAQSSLVFDPKQLPSIVFQDGLAEAEIQPESFSLSVDYAAEDNVSRILLKFTSGQRIWYQRLYAQAYDDVVLNRPGISNPNGEASIASSQTVTVGSRLTPPAGADSVAGYIFSGTNYAGNAYINPLDRGLVDAEAGAIIPVNALPGQDVLEVAWFEKIDPPHPDFLPFFTPSKVVSYTVTNPASSRQIVLASNAGSGVLSGAEANGSLYVQNDPGAVGYNPNEEHALISAGTIWALREDLNDPATTSAPMVLLQYTAEDGRPSMSTFAVVEEDVPNGHVFTYDVTVGNPLSLPMPLAIMPVPTANGISLNEDVTVAKDLPANSAASSILYELQTFEDKKGIHWVYRANHDGTNSTTGIVMHLRYNVQSGFAFPGNASAPAVGDPISYGNNGVSGTPRDVTYRPSWPQNVPVLTVGETLATAKFGLPAIRGQQSAQVLYQQSFANASGRDEIASGSVELIDPTAAKTAAIDGLPEVIFTEIQQGKNFFPALPPHLQGRFFYDGSRGTSGELVYGGEFVESPAGEDYFLLNTLSDEDILALKNLVPAGHSDEARWDSAIDGLSARIFTHVEESNGTFVADPNSERDIFGEFALRIENPDEAVDSYALAATGRGEGYVTLVFNNGEAFVDEGAPVTVAVIRVEDELYTGELKPLFAANPLSEQVSLHHTSDFGGLEEDYAFEYYYAFNDATGQPPTLFAENVTRVISSSLGNSGVWQATAKSSTDPLPDGSTVEGYDVLYTINNANDLFGKPDQAWLSLALGEFSGAIVYLNGQEVITLRAPGRDDSVLRTIPHNNLPFQFELEQRALNPDGGNVIEIACLRSAVATSLRIPEVQVDRLDVTDNVLSAGSPWVRIGANEVYGNRISLGQDAASPLNSPLLLISDYNVTMRYQSTNQDSVVANEFSSFTKPVLVEGWVKRVLRGINPFRQRTENIGQDAIDTNTSILSLAGQKWEGDIALNADSINDYGLIEIYETVFNRARGFSIDNNVNFAPANDALLLVSGYLNDLYRLYGDEAWADAINPTISINNGDDATEVNTSRFAFEGQVRSLLGEELVLLRGRDNAVAPGVQTAPFYNRLIWNFTRGIDSGEAIYALNYNIKERSGDDAATSNGIIDEADAARLYPQGHGDAYGHYLTSLKLYYRLLGNPNFTWVPRSETVTVAGQTVTVDYQDERKFAESAADLARVADEVVGLELRETWNDDATTGWTHLRDSNATRQWGADEWAHRSNFGGYLNWVTGNAVLLSDDTSRTGIQKIDRTTVPELDLVVASAVRSQNRIDEANAQLNPLGLTAGTMPFDISSTELKAGVTHFEQVQARALNALANAKGSFDQAARLSRFLRSSTNDSDALNEEIVAQELVFTRQLIEIYGTPYAGDIGPGKTYAQGYDGPDFFNSFVIDRPSVGHDIGYTGPNATPLNELTPINLEKVTGFKINRNEDVFRGLLENGAGSSVIDAFAEVESSTEVVQTNIEPGRRMQFSENFFGAGAGARKQSGTIQEALIDMYRKEIIYREHYSDLTNAHNELKRVDRELDELIYRNTYMSVEERKAREALAISGFVKIALSAVSNILDKTGDFVGNLGEDTAEAAPTAIGVATDGPAPARAAIRVPTGVIGFALQLGGVAAGVLADVTELSGEIAARQYEGVSAEVERDGEVIALFNNIARASEGLEDATVALHRVAVDYAEAVQRVENEYARADAVIFERTLYRKRVAATVQGLRTNDAVFRTFRNEALSQYRTLFDLAGRYTYMAAKAYDYETGLLGSDAGEQVFNDIIASRSLGDMTGGVPRIMQSGLGDEGLAGVMAKLDADYSVAKPRLGINNPDENGTIFSLRRELFRLPLSARNDEAWQQVLAMHTVDDLRDDPHASLLCRNLGTPDGRSVPGIVIPFSTTIEQGKNFFGLPLAGGDHAFTTSNFATRVFSVGMAFPGYVGFDGLGGSGGIQIGGGAEFDSLELSATPYIYLIPCGEDRSLAPPLGGNASTIRSWSLVDQALPLPFNLGATAFSGSEFFQSQDTLSEPFYNIRQHNAFRPVGDATLFYSRMPQEFTSKRLVGRSVWNTQWKIVIPAYTLLNDEQEGLDRFQKSVSDIQLFLRTYSYSGN